MPPKPKPTRKSTKKSASAATPPIPLNPVDLNRFTKMIARIRALEKVAAILFLRPGTDRSSLAQSVGDEVNRIQRTIRGPVPLRCSFPYCPANGVCELCPSQAARQHMAVIIAEIIAANS